MFRLPMTLARCFLSLTMVTLGLSRTTSGNILKLDPFQPNGVSVKEGDVVFGNKPIPPRWEFGATIRVFVQDDPNSNRDDLIKQGILRWQPRLDRRNTGIKIEVEFSADGLPPTNTPNAVSWQFVSQSQPESERTVGQGNLIAVVGNNLIAAAAVPSRSINSPFFNSGRVLWLENLVAGEIVTSSGDTVVTDADVVNTAEHEFSHILGLGHDDTRLPGVATGPAGSIFGGGLVTEHNQLNRKIRGDRAPLQTHRLEGMSRTDIRELNSLYDKRIELIPTSFMPQSQFHFVGANPAGTAYTYLVQFNPLEGDDVIPPEDQHVPLLTFGIDPSLVTAIEAPPGWIGVIPDGPPTTADPFYSLDGYLLNTGLPLDLQAGVDPIIQQAFVSVRSSLEEAIASGVAADSNGDLVDPALSLDTPEILITLHTVPGLQLGLIPVYGSDGAPQAVAGPVVVPEPSSSMLFIALVAAGILPRRSACVI